MIKLYSKAKLPTQFGEFDIYTFSNGDANDHAVLAKGEVIGGESIPVRIHSECLTGDVFGSQRCDCRQQLVKSLEYLSGRDTGILIYLRQEGRGIGLLDKIKAYSLQEEGYDTVEANLMLGLPADRRDYEYAIEVLQYFKVKSVALMSNNPKKFQSLEQHGIKIAGRIPLIADPTPFDEFYLDTKKRKMGHRL